MCSIRAVVCLKTGDAPGSIDWALKAVAAFDAGERDTLLDIVIFNCGVHTMEILRRQGQVPAIVTLRALLVYQTHVRTLGYWNAWYLGFCKVGMLGCTAGAMSV